MKTNRHNLIPALALCVLGVACGDEADTFTDLRGSVQVQGAEVTPATEGDTGEGATEDGADGGTSTTDTTYTGSAITLTVTCGADTIGPRNTDTNGGFRFSTRLDPPDRLPAGNCQICATEAPQGFTMAALCQSVEVLDSAVTNVVVLVTPVTPHPEEPPHPSDPLLDDPEDPDTTPEVVEDGGALDPAEPWCTITVRLRDTNFAGALLNGMEVTVGSTTLTTGPVAEGEEGGFAEGEAVFTGLECVFEHNVVVRDPAGNFLSHDAAVTFPEGITSRLVSLEMIPVTNLWGNGVAPTKAANDTHEPDPPFLGGALVPFEELTSCTVTVEGVVTVLYDDRPDCSLFTYVLPGATTIVTACKDAFCASQTVTVAE